MSSATTRASSPWVAGQPGDKNHRRFSLLPLSVAMVDMALDQIAADEIEREVAHLVRRVEMSTDRALRVVRMFREPANDAGPQLKLW